MSNWLIDRLPPAKKIKQRWRELAEAVQLYWEENFYKSALWAQNLRSIYTADSDGINKLIAEMDNFFNTGEMDNEEKPIALAMRKYELLHKDREQMLLLTLKRVFKGLVVNWIPLYARKSDIYGARFYTLNQVRFENLNLDEFYMTCRGNIGVDSHHLTATGMALPAFDNIVNREIPRILPLHIVFEGVEVNNKELNLNMNFAAGCCITLCVKFRRRSL